MNVLLKRIRREDFSPRELEVMRLIALGLSTKEVAVYLELAYKTVDNYRLSIFRKLSVRNVVHLVHCAMALGLLDAQSIDQFVGIRTSRSRVPLPLYPSI